MTDADVFHCHKCKALVRGVGGDASPGPDGSMIYTARCGVCKSKVHKVVYPEKDGRTLSPQPQLPYDSQRSLGGIPERPSMILWSAFIKSLAELLPESMLSNVSRVASILWYNHLTMNQKKALIAEFESSGKVTIPLEDLKLGRQNPSLDDLRKNPSPLDAEAKKLLERIVEAFWAGEKVEALIYGWLIATHPQYHNLASGELSELILTADGIEIATFVPVYGKRNIPDKKSKGPTSFNLSLFDAGLYSHKNFKSPVTNNSSFVVAGALILLLKMAPFKRPGSIKFEKGVLVYTGDDYWPAPEPLEVKVQARAIPKEFSQKFWVMFEVFGKEETIAKTDIGDIIEKIDAKERIFAANIEKLYKDDPDLARQSQLDLVKVARLMGDTEYEKLLELRDRLFWEEESSLLKPPN